MKTDSDLSERGNILMVGVGGQGIIMASDIFALSAMHADYDVKKSEIHGMSQRGGSVFSHVRYAPKVHSPVIPLGAADIVVSFELMETLRWIEYAHAGSVVVVLVSRITPPLVDTYPTGVQEELAARCRGLELVDPEELAKLAQKRYLNVALLGMVAWRLPFPDSAWRSAIEQRVPAGSFERNWEAFAQGRALKERGGHDLG